MVAFQFDLETHVLWAGSCELG